MPLSQSDIHEYWRHRAKENHPDFWSVTSNDPILAELEVRTVLKEFTENTKSVLEIGCGNGRVAQPLVKEFQHLEYEGWDAVDEMVSQADALNLPRSRFVVRDACHTASHPPGPWDRIVFVRALSNIARHEDQRAIVHWAVSAVHPRHGALVLVEPTVQGVRSINEWRRRLDLPPVVPHEFNLYVDLDRLLELYPRALVTHFASTYYLASRVFYAVQCKLDGVEPEYLSDINKACLDLPSLPILLAPHVKIVIPSEENTS